MQKLSLLFTKDGLQYQISKNRNVSEEQSFFVTEETPENDIADQLAKVLANKNIKEIAVFSALNHFTLMPEGFSQHD